jgi:hypothetical protein
MYMVLTWVLVVSLIAEHSRIFRLSSR